MIFRARKWNQLYGFQPRRRSVCNCWQGSQRTHLWHRNPQGSQFLINSKIKKCFLPLSTQWLCDQVGLSVMHSFCHSVCVQDYCKSNPPISLKLRMTGPTSQKNWLTFSGDPVPDMDCRSLLYFPHLLTGRFVSISHTVTGRFSRHSAIRLTLTS